MDLRGQHQEIRLRGGEAVGAAAPAAALATTVVMCEAYVHN